MFVHCRSLRAALFSFAALLAPLTGTAQAPALPEDPAETALLEVLAAAEAGHWETAEIKLYALQQKHPYFRPAERLHEHLDKRRLPEPAEPVLLAPEDDEYRPDNLDAEWQLRRQGARAAPPPGHVAAGVLRLDETIQTALLVDLPRARLYVLENRDGLAVPVEDYYAGIGKQGAGKQYEGDHRTPIGVYRIMRYIPDPGLPELYGTGAWPIDYPSPWDRRLNRTGSGIWLHGVPRDTYSRPPRSSRGCVTLSNDIFDGLRPWIEAGTTPVILSTDVQWTKPETQQQRAGEILAAIEQWRRDWESLDFERYIAHYSPEFRSGNQDYVAWKARKRAVNAGKQTVKVTLTKINVFDYPGEENLVQVGFYQEYVSDNYEGGMHKRQYWRREDGRWRIVYEGS